MRAAHTTYRTCLDIVQSRSNWSSDAIREEFESGTSLGNGMIQLILSHLPTKLLKLMSLVGYFGDRDFGLRELHKATDDYRHTARYKITDLVVCIYNLYVEQMASYYIPLVVLVN